MPRGFVRVGCEKGGLEGLCDDPLYQEHEWDDQQLFYKTDLIGNFIVTDI